ncbi:guanine nucleotide binding protein, alpha subunit [Zopfochytrium polystomum]|nr:guanine nucleotide binding protein, alpha subunit [Zopfochytrium polystomum]
MPQIMCGSAEAQEEAGAAAIEAFKASKKIDKEIQEDASKRKRTARVLILGTGDSGKSTVLKQLKLLYGSDFTPAERDDYALRLRENLFNSAKLLIRSMEALGIPFGGGEETGPAEDAERVKAAAGVLAEFEIPAGRAAIGKGVVEALEVLWRDPGVQRCALRGNEFALLDSCEFLMQNAKEICSQSYTPSNDHIVRVRVMTTAVSETKLTVKGAGISFFDVGGQKRFRAKWAPFFDDVNAIIFVGSLGCYDQKLEEDSELNRMEDSVSAFGCICNHTLLKHIPIILFLNKTDVFANKVKTSPIEQYFPDYKGGASKSSGANYFLAKYMAANRNPNKQVVTHFTWATDRQQTQKILEEVAEVILNQSLAAAGIV